MADQETKREFGIAHGIAVAGFFVLLGLVKVAEGLQAVAGACP